MEQEEEPQRSVPIPSPHPSSGLEASSALELTPEKPLRRRKIKRPVQLKQHDFRDGENGHDSTGNHGSPDVRVCAELAVPGLNTTAPLYHQLQQYKQTSTNMAEKRRETCRDPQGIATEDPLPLSVSVSVCQLSSISTLPTTPSIESVDSKPVEVDSDINVIANHFLPVTVLFLEDEGAPLCGTRYSELVAVDVSEESFQRLITRPRKTHRSARGGRGRKGEKRNSPAAEPNIMDFFSADFEIEDAGVDSTAPATSQLLEPIVPSALSALTLYHFVKSV